MTDSTNNAQTIEEHKTFDFIPKYGQLFVTPELAEGILTHMGYSRQRSTKTAHVLSLGQKMLRGRFFPGTSLEFGFVEAENRYYLVNGQHRLAAVSFSKQTIEFGVSVIRVPSEVELKDLYNALDTDIAQRTTKDIIRNLDLQEQFGFETPAYTAKLYNAAPIAENNLVAMTGAKYPEYNDHVYRGEVAQKWFKYAKVYWEILKDTQDNYIRNVMQTSYIMALAMITIKHLPEKADEFWRGIVDEDGGLEKDDPRKKIYKVFIQEKGITAESKMRYCLTAWKSFLKGHRSVKRLSISSDKMPYGIALEDKKDEEKK